VPLILKVSDSYQNSIANIISESPRAQRRALKAQRRAIKMVERRKEVEKREMLADRFKERMLRRKKAFLPKDIRRFVKLSLQEKMSKKEYLKPNQIDKMRSIGKESIMFTKKIFK
jgi:hypothetical protein